MFNKICDQLLLPIHAKADAKAISSKTARCFRSNVNMYSMYIGGEKPAHMFHILLGTRLVETTLLAASFQFALPRPSQDMKTEFSVPFTDFCAQSVFDSKQELSGLKIPKTKLVGLSLLIHQNQIHQKYVTYYIM